MKATAQTIATALLFARNAHAGQTRRDLVTPYFFHVSDVAHRVAKSFGYKPDGDAAVATAYLHDVLEDTDTTESDLRSAFPEDDIVDAVVAMTHGKNEPYDDYIARVATNPIARVVKIHDIQSNLADNPTDRQTTKYQTALKTLTQ